MREEGALRKLAWDIRKGILESISAKGGGHIGGSLDLAELFAVLYGGVLRVRPEEPDWPGRDYLVCSKGHAGPCAYAALALCGFFPYERLMTLNSNGTLLPGHCDREKVPGIDATTGSLGQGLSIACGLALGARLSRTDQKVCCILGDGELAEGQNWEAAQFASHHKLGNLIAFLDWNKMQIDGRNEDVMALGDVQAKFQAFGWDTRMVNGRDISAIGLVIREAMENLERPMLIVLDTVKGAGIPCIESLENNHCIGVPQPLAEKAMSELMLEKPEAYDETEI
ncbi:transketolase [Oscillospiraceae bacterium 50-16]|jgi:transketolase